MLTVITLRVKIVMLTFIVLIIIMLSVFMLNIFLLGVFMQCAMPNGLMLCIIMLGLITLCNNWVIIMLTSCDKQFYAECCS